MDFLFVILATLLSALFGFLRYKYTYWELQGVKQLKTHFLFGNFFKLNTIHYSELLKEVYEQLKGQVQLAGSYIYTKPIAVILDLELVKAILIKDFNKFIDRNEYTSESDPLSAHLFHMPGDQWRQWRTKLTPTFTSGRMKYMFPTMVTVAQEFKEAFEMLVRKGNENGGAIELHDMMARFTTDVIGNCIFGIECHSLKDENAEFRNVGRKLFSSAEHKNMKLCIFRDAYASTLKRLGFKRNSPEFTKFFMNLVRNTVEMRESMNIKRNDFIDILIDLKNSKSTDDGRTAGMTTEQIAAQLFVFFVAGFETSSSNMSYALYELAKNTHVQLKLRNEILEVLARHGNVLTYEAMMEMTYLDQVITETLRKYPALAALTRIATENYDVPGTNITLEKGTKVYIPLKAIHYDPEIYDNPNEFRPERFSADECKLRHPQAFLGFGDGPRNCIGLRFGRMQVRVGLITLLKSFKFSMDKDTPTELCISKTSFILVPENGVWLRAEKI